MLPKPASISSSRICAHRLPGEMLKPVDLDRRPALQVQLRIGVVQDADDVQVPLELHLVVQAADDVHLGAAVVDRFAAAGQDLLVAHRVPLRVAQVGAERAERAAIHADVRRVQMRVDVVVGEVAVVAARARGWPARPLRSAALRADTETCRRRSVSRSPASTLARIEVERGLKSLES